MATTGFLYINSKPYGDMTINGRSYGRVGFQRPGELGADTYQVQITSRDGEQQVVTFELDAGETLYYCWDFHNDTTC